MQPIEKNDFINPENRQNQVLISSLTYWKHNLKNTLNRCSLLMGKLLREGTPY